MTATLVSLGALTVAGYQLRTGDTDSAASAVTGALVDAQSLLEDELDRLLASDERTETMRIHADSRVYPKAWPITVCASNTIDGRSLIGAVMDLAEFIGLIGTPPLIPPKATITYTGGFDETTLPVTLRDALYDLAHARLHGSAGVPQGTSVRVGDVSVSGITPGDGIDSYVAGLSARVRRYRRPKLGTGIDYTPGTRGDLRWL